MDNIPDFRNGVCKHPHVVILGAGASLAAFPNGDKNGRVLPLMNSLVSTLGLTNLLKDTYAPLLENFEKLYSTIHAESSKIALRKKIEEKVYAYFHEMQISDEPTLYDYLILSLREKDVIATFNWDPLLLQAYRRHSKFQKHLPEVLFLHGNVAVGICSSCNILGYSYNKKCHRCNRIFKTMPLLYPVSNKNYNKNKYIKGQWDNLQHILKYAYFITIFGYSAPDTDIDAKELMLNALEGNKSRVFSEIDIVDIKDKSDVENNWYDFFYSHHYSILKNVTDSYLWYHPRRSCDAFASATLMNDPWKDNLFPKFKTIKDMHEWIEPYIIDEIEANINYTEFKYK